jgi:hypothetical protein
MVRMNRAHTYSPLGKCIYCGGDRELDREHIIAKSLGGMLVLPEASCVDCAKATSAVEGRIAGELYRAIRREMNFPTRKPRNRPRGFEVGLDGVDASVLADGYPGLLISFAFPLPGILTGAVSGEEFGGGVAIAMLPQFGERLNALGGPPRGRRTVEFRGFGDAESLGRVLAKSAYAYAVAELGVGGFHPFPSSTSFSGDRHSTSATTSVAVSAIIRWATTCTRSIPLIRSWVITDTLS